VLHGVDHCLIIGTFFCARLYPRGLGTFQTKRDFALDERVFRLAAGDVNGDGFADLVTGYEQSSGLRVFISRGDGTFQAPVQVAMSDETLSLALTDLNGDGRLDVGPDLVVSQGYRSEVSVLYGKCR